jgi:peptidoglycan hydrolase-like amidase
LCQYGAQELAGKGESFESILQWYYPGATLSSLS